MASKLNCCQGLIFLLIICAVGVQIVGFVTEYWLVGSVDNNSTDTYVRNVNVGLFKETIEFSNGTIIEQDSSLNVKEEQYIYLAVAGCSALVCLVLVFKAVHVLVGIASFVLLTLLFVAVFYTFERMSDKKGELKEYNFSWPTLEFSWSFALMAGGLILNFVSSAIFLTILLIKGERKASRSTKGLGPSSAKMDKGISGDKVPIISVISHENEAFNNDDALGNGSNYGNTDTQEYDVISGNTSLGFGGPVDAEIVQERSKRDSDPTRHNYMNDDGACAKVNVNFDGKGKMQANQSSIENEVEPDFYNIASQHTDIVTDLDADSYNENGPYEILDIQAHIDDEDYTSIRL